VAAAELAVLVLEPELAAGEPEFVEPPQAARLTDMAKARISERYFFMVFPPISK